MNTPGFGRKPSKSHIVWTVGTSSHKKRFDESLLRRWCDKYEFEFDIYERVDHDRGDESREQYRCTFSWQSDAGATIEHGDEEWTISTDRIPRTFVEIDEEGLMRVRGWSVDHVLDVRQLWFEGTELIVVADGYEDPQHLDAAELTR